MRGSSHEPTSKSAALFPGNSEMALRMRAFDWSTTDLGPPETWPQNLRIALSLCLSSCLPMQIWWGHSLALLYNDASISLLGQRKHPAVLGGSARMAWDEIWDSIGPMVERVLADGTASCSENIMLCCEQELSQEEMYATFFFSPVLGVDQTVEGICCICTETTEQIVGTRRRADERKKQFEIFDPVLAHLQEYVYLFDLEGRFLYVNKPLLDLWGLTLEQAVGKNFFDLRYPDELAGRHQAEIQRVIETAQPVEGASTYTNPAGMSGQYEYTFVPLFAADGSVEAVGGQMRVMTECRQAETALKASEMKYRMLFESIDQGFCIIEVLFDGQDRPIDYRFLGVSPSFERQTGLENAVGKTMLELEPHHEAHWFEIYGRVALTGEPVRLEARAEQLHRWFDLYAFRVGEAHERKVAVLFNDITERKRVEAALRESEGRFRLMADAVPQIVWITDPEGRTEFFNKQWTLYTGAPYEPTTAAEIAANFVHPDDRAMTMEVFNAARQTGSTFAVEHRIRSAAGRYRWFLVRAEPYRDPQTGEILRWFGASIDIHDRKQAEAAVRASEAQFRAVADLVPDLLWSNDANGWTDWYNQRWLRYTGQTAEEAQGYGWLDAIHPDDRELSRQAFQSAIDSGTPLRREHRMRRVDGTYRWFLVQAQPLADDAGRTVRWYGAATDVHQERLALAAAQAALQTRNQFLSIASHELRTPLTSLIGYAHMLPTIAAHGMQQINAMSERIIRQAQRLDTLIDQLLDVSRLQRGQFAIERHPVDLAELVAHVVGETHATQPPDTKHPIYLCCPDEPVMVVGDAQRLEQVLVNLLTNAIKYSPAGGPIEVRVCATATDAIVEVEDRGIGIPTESQARLCEAFYRASNVGTQLSGFGLGLHIVREIVQRHGGRIEVESTEGQGSTFRVALPLGGGAG